MASQMSSKPSVTRRTLICGVLCGLFAGMMLPRGLKDETEQLSSLSLRSLDEANRQLIEHYQAPLNESALTDAALQGMVGMLDEHSQVLSERAYAQLKQALAAHSPVLACKSVYATNGFLCKEYYPTPQQHLLIFR